MSVINDSIKQFLAEVEKFFYDTIKNEKLGKKAQEHKQLILDKLTKIFEENPYLKVSAQDTGKGKENQDESLFTGGSSKSDNSEENAYNSEFSDYGILKVPASELKNPAFSGSLEKKQKKGSGLFGGPKLQTRWCVIHGGNFYYYVRNEDKKQAGCFKLAGYSFRNNPDITKTKKDKELAFELYNEDKARRVYQFVAHSNEDYEQVKMAVHCGGFIEESDEMYDAVGNGPPPPTPSEMYVEKVGVSAGEDESQELYEEPDKVPQPQEPHAQRPPTPPPPIARGHPSKSGSALPPLPVTPVPQKPAEPAEPEPPLIEEDIYEDGSSVDANIAEKPSVSTEKSHDDAPPPPPPPPARGLPPQPPVPPASESLAHRRLPPTPVEPPKKKKIKLNLTCKPAEDFENQYFGKWDCKGDNPNELTFNKGDIIHILSKEFDEKSWWIGELKGNFGLVPKTYLTPAYDVVA